VFVWLGAQRISDPWSSCSILSSTALSVSQTYKDIAQLWYKIVRIDKHCFGRIWPEHRYHRISRRPRLGVSKNRPSRTKHLIGFIGYPEIDLAGSETSRDSLRLLDAFTML
jgi:hypothetical protein